MLLYFASKVSTVARRGLKVSVHGVLGDPSKHEGPPLCPVEQTYEIVCPSTIGLVRSDEAGIVLGKHSGRWALLLRLVHGRQGLRQCQCHALHA